MNETDYFEFLRERQSWSYCDLCGEATDGGILHLQEEATFKCWACLYAEHGK